LDGASYSTPLLIEGVQGVTRFLSAPEKQVFGDSIYFFKNWLDGTGNILREIKANDHDQSYTAVFSGIAKGQGSGLTVHYYDTPEPTGVPYASTIDSILDHNYFLDPPYPGLPKDFFSIQWEGYIQPYRSGDYIMSLIADDGFSLEINDQVFLEDLIPGFHFVSDTIYLEGGRLYPIRLQLREELWGAQIQLRWSGTDFDEEIVPTSQLYPVDFLTTPTVSGISITETLVGQELQLKTESFQNTTMDISIMDIQGRVWRNAQQYLPAGKNVIRLDIDFLAPGVYYFSGRDHIDKKVIRIPFVKVR
jgi:hypothetical protein